MITDSVSMNRPKERDTLYIDGALNDIKINMMQAYNKIIYLLFFL